jgi:hypothetical protein
MKVMFKPNRIESYDAIQVTKDMIGKVITDTPITKQEIVFEDNQLILRAHEIDNNDMYKSTQDIDVYINEGDYLIKSPKGYMKPVNKVYLVDKQLERAIKHINEIK